MRNISQLLSRKAKGEKSQETRSQFQTQLADIQRRLDRAYRRQTPEEILTQAKAALLRRRDLVAKAVRHPGKTSIGKEVEDR